MRIERQRGSIRLEAFGDFPWPTERGRVATLDLLRRDAETVAYHLLPALLLNEYQKEHQQLAEVHELKQQLAAQASRMAHIEGMLASLQAQAKESQIAMR